MKKILISLLLVVFLAAPAVADWNPGDGHKMHFPQLPDPTGWDIDVVGDTVYDDFKCTQTGPIEDIHFWASWKGDQIGQINWIDISFHGDVPGPPSHPDSVMYGNPLWSQRFLPGQFVVAPPEFGNQGWLPPGGTPIPNDHTQYFQINITDILNPLIQDVDTIYWMGIHVGVPVGPAIGWKTSLDHWEDDAVYYYGGWQELIDPFTYESLDMAFVITPEPATIALLGLGALALLRKRKA